MNTENQKIQKKENINLGSLKIKSNLGRRLVQNKCKINDDDIETVEFIFWVVYYLERITEEFIVGVECRVGARQEPFQMIVDKLHFGDKISIFSDLYAKNSDKNDFVKFLRKVNDLRNAVAHGRFSELVYKGQLLSDTKGQTVLVEDFIKFAENLSLREFESIETKEPITKPLEE